MTDRPRRSRSDPWEPQTEETRLGAHELGLVENDSPHHCGGTLRLTHGPQEIAIRGSAETVDVEFLRCDSCGEELLSLDQLDRARVAASESLIAAEGLMSPAEIRQLRDRLGMTQVEFEGALRLGPKSMARWETGRVMPSRAMSLLLLLIRRDPSAMGFLTACANGVQLAEQVVRIRVEPQPQWRVAKQDDLLSTGFTGEHPVMAA